MDAMTTGRLVLVDARQLGELLELAQRIADRTDQADPLVHALRGTAAQLRAGAVIEPTDPA